MTKGSSFPALSKSRAESSVLLSLFRPRSLRPDQLFHQLRNDLDHQPPDLFLIARWQDPRSQASCEERSLGGDANRATHVILFLSYGCLSAGTQSTTVSSRQDSKSPEAVIGGFQYGGATGNGTACRCACREQAVRDRHTPLHLSRPVTSFPIHPANPTDLAKNTIHLHICT